jgi:hypothetical protein
MRTVFRIQNPVSGIKTSRKSYWSLQIAGYFNIVWRILADPQEVWWCPFSIYKNPMNYHAAPQKPPGSSTSFEELTRKDYISQ